jgi:hypothetical protein
MNIRSLSWASEAGYCFDINWKVMVFIRNELQVLIIDNLKKDEYLYQKYNIKPYDKFLLTLYETTDSVTKELTILPIKVDKRGKEVVHQIVIPFFKKENSLFGNSDKSYLMKYVDYYFEALTKIFNEEYEIDLDFLKEYFKDLRIKIENKEYESIPDFEF